MSARCAASGSAATCSTSRRRGRARRGAGARTGGARATAARPATASPRRRRCSRSATTGAPRRRGARSAPTASRAGWRSAKRWPAASRSCRDGAMAFFSVAPARFGRGGLETAAAWCALGRELAATSPQAGGDLLAQHRRRCCASPAALARLRRVGRGRTRASTASTAGRASFSPRPTSPPRRTRCWRSHPAAYRLWAGAGAALYPAVKEREFFGRLPRARARLGRRRAGRFLRTTIALAGAGGEGCAALYRELPASLGSARRAGARRRCCACSAHRRQAAGRRRRRRRAGRRRAAAAGARGAAARRAGAASNASPPSVPTRVGRRAALAAARLRGGRAPRVVREWFDDRPAPGARQPRGRPGLLRARVAHQPQGAARRPRPPRRWRRCRACCASTCRC